MNAFNQFRNDTDDPSLSSLAVSETYWGYIIRERDLNLGRRQLREMALLFVGAIMMLVGFGQWLIPGSLVALELIPLKIALTAVFVGIGGVCWHTAGSRTQIEVHIDTALREIRVVARDRRGLTQLIQRVRMSEIDSAYIKEGVEPTEEGHLLLDVAHSERPLHLATGSERELRLLHDRVRNDLRPAQERVERRLMRQASDALQEVSEPRVLTA